MFAAGSLSWEPAAAATRARVTMPERGSSMLFGLYANWAFSDHRRSVLANWLEPAVAGLIPDMAKRRGPERLMTINRRARVATGATWPHRRTPVAPRRPRGRSGTDKHLRCTRDRVPVRPHSRTRRVPATARQFAGGCARTTRHDRSMHQLRARSLVGSRKSLAR